MMLTRLLLLVLLLAWTGCSDAPQKNVSSTPSNNQFYFTTFPATTPTAQAEAQPWIDAHGGMTAFNAWRSADARKTLEILHTWTTQDRKKAHETTVTYLHSLQDHPFRSLPEQLLAERILNEHLLPDQSADPHLIAYYTQLLDQNRSASADVMDRALSRLRTVWTLDQIVQMRVRSVLHAQQWLKNQEHGKTYPAALNARIRAINLVVNHYS